MPSVNKCHYCGGKFGLIRHHWWGEQYCSLKCFEAAEIMRNRIREFLKFLRQ